MSEKLTGTVDRWLDEKGFGFIRSEQGRYFCHQSQILMSGFRRLEEGQEVTFYGVETAKGPEARSVLPL